MHFPRTQATLHTLKNGLKVILDQDSYAPVISAQLWVETGSIHEGAFLGAGISHLLEHMVFKGTRSFTGEELNQNVHAAGGQWNAYTTYERTVYYIDGPAAGIDIFLQSLLEMVFEPSLPEDEFEKEKDVIRREIDMGNDDPERTAQKQLFATACIDTPFSQPVIGHIDLFNQITHNDMLDYHQQRYTTDNAFLVLSGDFDKAATLTQLEALNSEIERTLTTHAVAIPESPQQGKRLQRSTFTIPTSKISLAWKRPDDAHPDATAFCLIAQMLGGGKSSPLYQVLREQRQLCHSIASWNWTPKQGYGLFVVSAETPLEQCKALEAAIREQITTFCDRCPADLADDLAKAQRMILSNQFSILTNCSARASDLASNWHLTRNLDHTADYLEKIHTVSTDDLLRVARHYLLDDSTLTISSVDPHDAVATSSEPSATASQAAITQHQLSNSATLLHCHDTRTPTIYIQCVFRGGSFAHLPENAGISTFLSRLLTKGTHTRSGEEIANTLESLGASISASAGKNTLLVSAQCLTPDVEIVMEILGDILSTPAFPAQDIELQRQAQHSELQALKTRPLSLASLTAQQQLFGDIGYGLPSCGTEHSIDAISQDALHAFHQQLFNADNLSLAIFGDIKQKAAKALAEHHLSALPRGQRFEYPQSSYHSPQETSLSIDAKQAVLVALHAAAPISSPDLPALMLWDTWCSDMAGPLFARIREELGLAYYCSSNQQCSDNTGYFLFYLGTSPDQLPLAKEQLSKIIEGFTHHLIEPETLENVKSNWHAKQALSRQSKESVAMASTIDVAFGLSPTHHLRVAEQIDALTPTDMLAAAKKYFTTPHLVTVSPDGQTED